MLEELLDGATPAPPVEIFHYTSPTAFQAIIGTGTLRLTNAAYLNDEAELTYPLHVAIDALQALAQKRPSDKERILEIGAGLPWHAVNWDWYVASFSTRGNQLSQWRAYCPSGGYSIGFDGTRLGKALGSSPFRPVIYDRQTQMERTVKIVEHALEQFPRYRGNVPDMDQAEYDRTLTFNGIRLLRQEFIFWKALAFSEEEEWRVAKLRIGPAGRTRPTGTRRCSDALHRRQFIHHIGVACSERPRRATRRHGTCAPCGGTRAQESRLSERGWNDRAGRLSSATHLVGYSGPLFCPPADLWPPPCLGVLAAVHEDAQGPTRPEKTLPADVRDGLRRERVEAGRGPQEAAPPVAVARAAES